MIDLPVLDATLAVALAAFVVAGLVRGFAGFGNALILTPSLSLLFSPAIAVPTLVLIDLAGTLPFVPRAARRASLPQILPLAIAAAVCLPLGVWALAVIDPELFRVGVGIVVLVLTGLLAAGWRYRGQPYLAARFGVGGIAGFFNGIAGIGGVPVVLFWLAGSDSAGQMRANIFTFFCILATMTVVGFALGGLITATVLGLVVVGWPTYVAGLIVGARLFPLASERVFRRVALVLIAAVALVSVIH